MTSISELCYFHFNEIEEIPVPAGVREQLRALADDHGEGEQVHLVNKIVAEQPPEQGTAAVHLQLASRLGFQLADGGRELTGEDGRVRPPQVGECGRCHVLGLRVQLTLGLLLCALAAVEANVLGC